MRMVPLFRVNDMRSALDHYTAVIDDLEAVKRLLGVTAQRASIQLEPAKSRCRVGAPSGPAVTGPVADWQVLENVWV